MYKFLVPIKRYIISNWRTAALSKKYFKQKSKICNIIFYKKIVCSFIVNFIASETLMYLRFTAVLPINSLFWFLVDVLWRITKTCPMFQVPIASWNRPHRPFRSPNKYHAAISAMGLFLLCVIEIKTTDKLDLINLLWPQKYVVHRIMKQVKIQKKIFVIKTIRATINLPGKQFVVRQINHTRSNQNKSMETRFCIFSFKTFKELYLLCILAY